MGPLKHLGLSKAHGCVSSFVSICLEETGTSKSPPPIDNRDKKIAALGIGDGQKFSTFVSPVVPNDNNPVYDCQFELNMKRGAFQEGEPVRILLRVDEDAGLESMLPGIASAGGAARLLGIGQLDVTSLCLGQNPATGRPTTGLIDAWVPIRLPDEQEQGQHGQEEDW